MVAGPNGSGKTTFIAHIRSQGIDLGEYINPDDIAAGLSGSYDDRVRQAQRLADESRERCLAAGVSFTFETVMSHLSKIEFLARAAAAGFDSVLYFVSTGDPALNVARVAHRVARGGHDVPRDKIVSRYERAMALLPVALTIADRAFVYENSGPEGFRLGLTKATERETGGTWRASYRLLDGAAPWIQAIYESIPPDGYVGSVFGDG
jgi:predicted ABC-type ATPase